MIKKKIYAFIVLGMMVGVMFIGLTPEVDADVENYEYKATENSTVQGFVEDLEENPVPNAEVGLWDPANGQWNGINTDTSGYYILYTSPGYFYFNVRKDGFMDYHSDINIGENEEHWINVSLSPRPDEPCILKGYVRNETEETLNAHVHVDAQVEGEEPTWWNDTDTNEYGYFEMNTISGNIEMGCDAPGYMRSSTKVSMSEGQVTWQNITLSKKPAENSRIYGYVNDTDDKPIVYAKIELSNWEMGYWNWTNTDANGYYSINCFAGTFDLEVRVEDTTRYKYTIMVGEGEQKLFNITIKAENAKIYGWVTSEKGNPLKDVEISLSSMDYWNNTYTEENGYYEMNCFAGTFWLNAYLDGYDYSGRQINIGDGEEKKVNITLKLNPPIVEGLTATPETNISQNNPTTISANVTSAKLKEVYLVIDDSINHQFIKIINITYSQIGETFTGTWDVARFGLGNNTDTEMPVTVWQIFSDKYMVKSNFSSTGKPEDALDGYAVFNLTTLELKSIFANGVSHTVENGGIIFGNSTFTVTNMFMSGEEQDGETFVISSDFMLHQETAPDNRTYKAIIFGKDEEENYDKEEKTLYLDTTKPGITCQTISQNIFSPEIGNVFISADVSEDVEWTITIKNSTAIIKTFTGSGIINQTWDGKDENGVMVDDGVYYIYFDGEDNGKNTADTVNTTVTVDKTPPLLLNLSSSTAVGQN
ncbi:MAG: carboxypeptidase regulatory-like domain-containing protein [Thermoplasmatales archaeon]|nr:carboxypeptidase regulatory-like domain-containing protein [Thermoplasmatales archaeon]